MAYFLGMDAGGSTTFAVITDEKGNVRGIGRSGNGNHQIDHAEAERNIHLATIMALEDARLTTEDIRAAWFGIAGADREVDFEILHAIVGELNLPIYDISGDTMIGLRAGTKQADGVVVICGTGVNCAGRNKDKVFYQCGGFGYSYGDFGGGGCLSVEVFRSVIREWDGRGEKTFMTDLLLEMLDYSTVEEMFHDFLDKSSSVPKDITRLLFPAAKQGDNIAISILEEQGKELGLSIQSVVKELEMEEDSFDVVLAGSVVTRGETDITKSYIQSYTAEVAPQANIVSLTVEPVVGAILLAMELAGEKIDEAIYETLGQIRDIGVK